jgi:predicted transcriptional regulator
MFGVHTLYAQGKDWLAIALIAFLMKKKPLSIEKKETIFNYIIQNPGCIIPEISRKYKLSIGTVRHYIRQLEYDSKITLMKFGKFTRLFTRRPELTDTEKFLFSFIKNETNKMLLLSIVDSNGITNHELSEKLHANKSIINKRLNKLLKNKIILSKSDGKTKHYYINEIYRYTILKVIK